MLGRNDDAIAAIDDMLKGEAKRRKIEDRVKYWKAKILKKMAKPVEANDIFKELIGKYPNGYYAVLSRRQIDGDERKADNFIHGKSAGSRIKVWAPDGGSQNDGSIHMSRVVFFDRLGLHDEVRRELEAIDIKRNMDLADQMMWYASRNMAYNFSMRIAKAKYHALLGNSPSSSALCRFVWEQIYPEAYGPVVRGLAREKGVDPILVWSIMRNESTFKPEIVSPAGAVGLMQLMPTTANRLMADSGDGRIDRRKLYRPDVNIKLGIEYLKKLNGMFPGNPVAVITSYNAGEEAVTRWIRNGSIDDIEEWIEEIPYAETNLYVKKVLASYWNYSRLYGN